MTVMVFRVIGVRASTLPTGVSRRVMAGRTLTHLEWQVKFEPGVLEARGTKDGKVVLTEKRETTTGKPESIRLTPDRTEINADGEDVAVLKVEIYGAGRALPTAANMISFKVTVYRARRSHCAASPCPSPKTPASMASLWPADRNA